MFEKKPFKVFATSSSLEIVLPFSIHTKISLDLLFSVKNGLTVCYKFLLSVISFSLRFAKYCFFSFLKSDKHKLRFLYQYTCFHP